MARRTMNRPRVGMDMTLIKAFVLAAGVATVARASLTYLPQTGPAPLRVAMVKAPVLVPETTKLVLVAPPVIPAHDTNSLAAVENCIADTNPVVITSKPSDDEATLPPIVLGADNPLQGPGANGASMMQAAPSDMMGISPEMLATYFKPNGAGTNAAVVVPLRVGFVPPLATPPSSHSEYNIK